MTYPRVLITTYHQAFLVKGGGEYEIFSIADSLKQRGMIVDIYGPYSRTLDEYDVILHFSVHGGGLDLLQKVKDSGKPIVLWPNLWVRDSKDVSTDLVHRHFELANAVIFKSLAEKNNFYENFNLPEDKFNILTLGADASYLSKAPKGLFKTLYNVDKYAIWFGVIEPNKNQLAAIRVLNKRGIKLVLIGRSREDSYLEKCIELGGENLLVIPGLPQKSEIVRSALQESMFYIEVGHEPPGMSAIEAGLSGCRLVLSDSSWSREHFGDHAIYADPASDHSIDNAVEQILSAEPNTDELISSLEKYCLPKAADPVIDILKSVVL